jgi:hypothetical protein
MKTLLISRLERITDTHSGSFSGKQQSSDLMEPLLVGSCTGENIQRRSEGANGPNIVGSGNTVIINQGDPKTQAQLNEIEALLKARQKKGRPPCYISARVCGVYVDYVSSFMTPYETREGLERFQFDFRPVRITKNTSDRIQIQLPDLIKDKKLMATGVKTGGRD